MKGLLIRVDEWARRRIAVGTGARSLRTIMEDLLLDIMYEAPSDNSITCLRITREFVEGQHYTMFDYTG